jgi:hypothetical protein
VLKEGGEMEVGAKGISLHIGLNRVDPLHYQGWNGALAGCENDARDMQRIAEQLGYTTRLLLNEEARAEAAIRAMESAAAELGPGDAFLLTYSGHGSQVPDTNGDEAMAGADEIGNFPDQYDETWVVFDRQLVDDELYALWARFAPNVGISVLSDSCHSGTVAKVAPWETLPDEGPGRRMPLDVQDRTYDANRKQYDEIQASVQSRDAASVKATVALISGCMDNQTSGDGPKNGRFTGQLLEVWQDGQFTGTLEKLRNAITAGMPPYQTPNYYVVGTRDDAFLGRPSFRI